MNDITTMQQNTDDLAVSARPFIARNAIVNLRCAFFLQETRAREPLQSVHIYATINDARSNGPY